MRSRELAIGLAIIVLAATLVAVGADVAAPGGDAAPAAQVFLELPLLAWAVAGAVIVLQRPGNRLGWLILGVSAVTQVSIAEEALRRGDLIPSSGVGLTLSVVGGLGVFVLLGLLPLLYPHGSIPGGFGRVVAIGVVLGAVLVMFQWGMSQLGWWAWPFDEGTSSTGAAGLIPVSLFTVSALVGWIHCAVRAARATSPMREQLVILLAAVVLTLIVSSPLPALVFSPTAVAVVQAVALMTLPAAIAVGILRYRLLGIESVLHRGLVYGLLTAAVVIVYGVAAWMGGRWMGASVLPSVMAAAVVAIGLLPLRNALQRGVDRLLYGDRRDPVGAVTTVGSLLAGSDLSELTDLLVGAVRDVMHSTGVELENADGLVVARVGDLPDGNAPGIVAVPLRVGGQETGLLRLGPPRDGGRFSGEEQRVLAALAPQVAAALHAVTIAAEVERQRDRAVSVRLEERERMRNDLHDGLGPSLTGISLGLQGVADAIAAEDSARAAAVNERVRVEVTRTVGEVRRLLDGLRPGVVERHGLADALAAAFEGIGPVVVVVGPLPDLTENVEDALYRVALEAVTNALRHADAERIRVDLGEAPSGVLLTVTDDGTGIALDAVEGVGLASMRSRAEAVGGTLEVETGDGTTIKMHVPTTKGEMR